MWGSGFSVQGSGSEQKVAALPTKSQSDPGEGYASGLKVHGSGFMVQGSGFRVQGSGFRVQSSGFKVQGSRFRVQSAGSGPTGKLGCKSRLGVKRSRKTPNTRKRDYLFHLILESSVL